MREEEIARLEAMIEEETKKMEAQADHLLALVEERNRLLEEEMA